MLCISLQLSATSKRVILIFLFHSKKASKWISQNNARILETHSVITTLFYHLHTGYVSVTVGHTVGRCRPAISEVEEDLMVKIQKVTLLVSL